MLDALIAAMCLETTNIIIIIHAPQDKEAFAGHGYGVVNFGNVTLRNINK